MGRFSAPSSSDHHDHHHPADINNNAADNDAAEPMDWTIISDDDDNEDDENDENSMLARMQLNDHTTDMMMVAYDNEVRSLATARHHNNSNGVRGTAARAEMENDAHYDAATIISSSANTNINNNTPLLQIIQQCLQQLQLSNEYYHHHLDNYNEQQQRLQRRKRNKKILTSILLMILIVCTIVLRWFAPPPPPFPSHEVLQQQNKNQKNSMVLPLLFNNNIYNNNNNNMMTDHPTILTHHETWGEYTTHLFQLTTSSILYTTSVLWYVISNSFRYAALDVCDRLNEFWMGVGERWLVLSSSSSSSLFTSSGNNEEDDDGNARNVIQVNRETACPIRIQAVCNYHTLLPRGAVVVAANNNNNNDDDDDNNNNVRIMEGLSTEESLRQYRHQQHQQRQRQQQRLISLPSQNMALQLIARGIDSWGESMVEDITTTFTTTASSSSVEVVHRMASFMMMRMGHRASSSATAATISSSSSSSNSGNGRNKENDVGVTLQEWMLPPAKGFLFVGPAGVGKLHVAQHVADWFFAHCNSNNNNSSNKSGGGSDKSCTDDDDSDEMRNPVLQIIGGDDDKTIRRNIIQHIQHRKGLGSVIIIHHIEQLHDNGLLSDIVKVLNGNANTIPYSNDDDDVDEKNQEVSCNGTIFLLTSEQWGTKRMFQMIQRNKGRLLNNNNNSNNNFLTGLLSGIRWEVDSHLNYWQRLNSHTIPIVPFLPFQEEDMLLVIQRWFQELSDMYQDIHWTRLDVSTSALEYSVGMDHVDYLDLYHDGNFQRTKTKDDDENDNNDDNDDDESQQSLSKPLITFSTNGAHALQHENSVYTALKSKLKNGTRRSPYKVAFLDMDEDTLEYILSWCDPEYVDVNECETEWRLRV